MTAVDALALLRTSLAISLPTFGWVLLGVALYRVGLLPRALNDRISMLSFRFGLPLMLFAGSAQVDFSAFAGGRMLTSGIVTTLLVLLLSWIYAGWRNQPQAQQGIFVQAAFRSNLAIIGLALAVAAYGERGTALAALPVAAMTVLYNILAVWVLNVTLGGNTGVRQVAVGILKNPLVIGISAGSLLALSPLTTPEIVPPAGAFLSAFFLPLMLICIGGSMDLSRLHKADSLTWEACCWRLLLAPLLGVGIALLAGVRDEALGVIFLLLATPVAVSGYVMVVAARGDGTLAANITVLSTLLSVVTITAGFFVLSLFSLVGTLQVS